MIVPRRASLQIPRNGESTTLAPAPFPVKSDENRDFWYKSGENAIRQRKNQPRRPKKAKNVILFVGDGMGVSTITAARILEGQMRGLSGEENALSFENLPYSALSKTYSANQQTSDSAPTMTAMVSGVKTKDGILSIDKNVIRGDYKTVAGNEVPTILELAEQKGLSTGVVSTARLTHATPGACYAHSPDRDWESDSNLPKDAAEAKFPDIARQLIEFQYGDGLEVAMGGGRPYFLPKETQDPEYTDKTGNRSDNRNLTEEWTRKYKDSAYIWNKAQFDAINPKTTKHLLGLFERSHLQYEHDRKNDKAGEPSLTEMTTKAIDILSDNKKGYFLMVEGGRVDHAHHEGNAYRALTDAVELSNAVRATLAKVNLNETLVIVTADHSHTFTISGYPTRGNNILGLVRGNDQQGFADKTYDLDLLGLPYTTLGYANGLGYTGATENLPEGGAKTYPPIAKNLRGIMNGRPDLFKSEVTNPNYLQESTVPLSAETHGGEDVAIFADGPDSNLISGVMEQSWIFNVMTDALRLSPQTLQPKIKNPNNTTAFYNPQKAELSPKGSRDDESD
ncbi:MAG: alkaline phosphatase [Pyrinomonadaceae bacterium]|nr:alkaline phosphatase [Pyrinomonadaceae bacterium]